jgi:hypothetical protein
MFKEIWCYAMVLRLSVSYRITLPHTCQSEFGLKSLERKGEIQRKHTPGQHADLTNIRPFLQKAKQAKSESLLQ